MFDLDKWQEIGNSLWQHKLRTLLTSLGIFWGIFILVFLLGAGKGLQNGVYQNFGSLNKNSLFVWGQRTSLPFKGLPPGRNINISNEDFETVKAKAKGIDIISPRLRLWSTLIKRKNKTFSYTVNGVNEYFQKIKEVNILQGRDLNKLDVDHKRKVTCIGKQVADKFFANENPIGQYIDIKGAYFKIVGVYKSKAMGEDAKDEEETLYIPYTSLQQTFNKSDEIGVLLLTLKEGFENSEVEADIKKIINNLHQVHPDDTDAVGAWGAQEEFNMISGLMLGINAFIWMVGLGTIFIGIISISNIMLIIIKERTKEIGLRKALGASPLSVVGLILQEAIVITSVPAFLGLIAGVFVVEGLATALNTFGIKNEFFANPEVDLSVAIISLLIVVFAGTLAGLIPAIQAAKIDPIEALRTE